MTNVVISQPMLFPWSGFFEQLIIADEYIYLDNVQYSRGFINRIQILNGDDRSWMTIPLAGKSKRQNILELKSAETSWKNDHLNLLNQSLRGSPYLNDALSIVEEVYSYDSLCDLLIASAEIPARYMEIGSNRRVHRSSQMEVPGASSHRIFDLVRAVSGTHYTTGHGAANYLDHQLFTEAQISVDYMRYSCTPWPQPRAEFMPYVSILDLIARAGKDARNYLKPGTMPWHEFLSQNN